MHLKIKKNQQKNPLSSGKCFDGSCEAASAALAII